jgi:CheY-like chemotaxis protein
MLSSGPKCVLIIDDDAAIRDMICEVLKSAGYRVEMTNDGRQPLPKWEQLDRTQSCST